MTGHVCPVHGEWSATGACRWCGPQPLPGLKGLWQKPDRVEVNEAGVPTYTWTFEQETPEAYVFRVEWTKAAAEAIAAGVSKACEARLAQEHAALRWERVARRWNYKHRRPGGLDCGGREWVWMHWLEQMGRRYAYLTWTPRQSP